MSVSLGYQGVLGHMQGAARAPYTLYYCCMLVAAAVPGAPLSPTCFMYAHVSVSSSTSLKSHSTTAAARHSTRACESTSAHKQDTCVHA